MKLTDAISCEQDRLFEIQIFLLLYFRIGTGMNTANSSYQLMDAMMVYLQGEKIEALVFILPVGLLSMVFGLWLYIDNGISFTKGVAIPFLVMGLVMVSVGAIVGYRTPAQITTLQAGWLSAPEVTRVAEVKRMEKINNAWKFYLMLWGAFGVLGLILRFGMTHDFANGLGIALIFFSGVGLMVDGFAERRTHPYIQALNSTSFSALSK